MGSFGTIEGYWSSLLWGIGYLNGVDILTTVASILTNPFPIATNDHGPLGVVASSQL